MMPIISLTYDPDMVEDEVYPDAPGLSVIEYMIVLHAWFTPISSLT